MRYVLAIRHMGLAAGNPLARMETLLVRRSSLVALISVLGLVVVFSILTPDTLLTGVSFSNIITFSVILGIIVIGVAILMVAGEFDLSVGSTFAVVGFTYGVLISQGGMNVWLAALVAVAAGALLGLFNGTVVVKSGNPSFIITLGMLLAYRGVARAIGGGRVVSYASDDSPFLFSMLNSGITALNELSAPAGNFRTSIIWFALLALVFAFVLHRTRFGNWVFATGGNRDAAQAQGVPTARVKLVAFVLVGVLVGISSVINFAERTSIDPLAGNLWELFAVAACVIGGLRLRGGFGTVAGACLGIVMISLLRQGLVLVGLSIESFQAVFGFLLIAIAALNQYLGRAAGDE